MGEENTHNLNRRSFEERVMARFDAIDNRFVAIDNRFIAMDNRFDAMDKRFDAMENRIELRFDLVESRLERLEARDYDTKPIWQRALTEIAQVDEKVQALTEQVHLLTTDMVTVKDQVQVLTTDMVTVKEQVQVLTTDMVIVKDRLQGIDYKFDVLIQDVMEVRTHERYLKARIDRLESS